MTPRAYFSFFFFFNDTATTEIYTLSLHDALPISVAVFDLDGTLIDSAADLHRAVNHMLMELGCAPLPLVEVRSMIDRKSTRLNSSHLVISYAVFCLKKKKT